METFNRQNIKPLRADINAALAMVAAKYDIEISAGNCSFSDMSCKFQLKCDAGDKEKRQQLAFYDDVKYARLIKDCEKLEPKHFGTIFKSGRKGELFKFNELSHTRSAYPIGAERLDDGKQFKFRSAVAAQIISAKQ